MDSSSQAEGAPLIAPMLEGAPSAPLMVGEEDSGTTPASSTRAALRKVVDCVRLLANLVYGRFAFVWIDAIV